MIVVVNTDTDEKLFLTPENCEKYPYIMGLIRFPSNEGRNYSFEPIELNDDQFEFVKSTYSTDDFFQYRDGWLEAADFLGYNYQGEYYPEEYLEILKREDNGESLLIEITKEIECLRYNVEGIKTHEFYKPKEVNSYDLVPSLTPKQIDSIFNINSHSFLQEFVLAFSAFSQVLYICGGCSLSCYFREFTQKKIIFNDVDLFVVGTTNDFEEVLEKLDSFKLNYLIEKN